MTYLITYSASPVYPIGYGSKSFEADRPFHAALAELLAEAGPVTFGNLPEEMRLAMAAGAFIDTHAIIGVLATAIGVFAADGDIDAPRRSHVRPAYGAPACAN